MVERRRNPTPLTEDQLTLISEETARAARKVLQRYTRRAVLGFLILLAGIGLVQYDQRRASRESRAAIVASGRVIAVDGCNRDFKSMRALRGILESASALQLQAYREGKITAERFKIAQGFYSEHLGALELPDCSRAKNILTDDPDAKVVIPDPLGGARFDPKPRG